LIRFHQLLDLSLGLERKSRKLYFRLSKSNLELYIFYLALGLK
jgi:hypothetical protein